MSDLQDFKSMKDKVIHKAEHKSKHKAFETIHKAKHAMNRYDEEVSKFKLKNAQSELKLKEVEAN